MYPFATIKEYQQHLFDGTTSCKQAVDFYLSQIKQFEHLNALVHVFAEEAMQRATELDESRAAGKPTGKLHGVVVTIKDVIAWQQHPLSAASNILKGFHSIYNSTAVQKLLAEDAIIIGTNNCDEFAMGSSNENSAYGPVKNKLDETRVPGGSSGGSAVAVQADLCMISLGSDTGGSIRQPASFTGTYGLKPSYGRISRYGLIAYASSFDQIGPFTNDLNDAALLLSVMAGKDEMDSTSSSKSIEAFGDFQKPEKLRIAVISESFDVSGIDAEVSARLEEIMQRLTTEGHAVERVSFPYLDYMVPTYYVLTTAEASSNLSRFDGVHFGHRSSEAKGVEQTYKLSRSEGFGPEVKRRIMAGTFVLSHGYYDAYYTKGQKVRRVLRNRTDEIFSQYDLILLPTTPSTAFRLNDVKDPIQMYLQDIYTVHANLTGNPAISLPLGKHSNGMPFGIQIMADHFAEKKMFDFSVYLENILK
mgnify:CR=1 FL=1